MFAVTLRGSGCALAPLGDESSTRDPLTVILRYEPEGLASKDDGRCDGARL
jgi:hypothetical protein